jgi:hypothetical protein
MGWAFAQPMLYNRIRMYTPQDFEKHKMHCLKYLWIFQQRAQIIKEMIRHSEEDIVNNLTIGNNVEMYMEEIISALSYSKQVLQFKTGMNDEDLNEALKIGSILAEFIITASLDEDEREEYFGMIDEPAELTDMQAIRLKTIREKIESIYNGTEESTVDFDDIIKRNFGEDGGEFRVP